MSQCEYFLGAYDVDGGSCPECLDEPNSRSSMDDYSHIVYDSLTVLIAESHAWQ